MHKSLPVVNAVTRFGGSNVTDSSAHATLNVMRIVEHFLDV